MSNLSLFKELLQQELALRAHKGQEQAVEGAIYAVCLRLHITPTTSCIHDYLSQSEGVIK